MIKLDYSLASAEERKELVEQILIETPDPSERYMEILASYMVQPIEKEEKKKRKILTDNRMTTINKRELSYEGLADEFESGEDGIYCLITENKQTIFQPKISITKKDVDTSPDMQSLRSAIELWETALPNAEGRDAFIIKRSLIEMRKDQYIIKASNTPTVNTTHLTRSPYSPPLDSLEIWDPAGRIAFSGITFLDKKVCCYILCNYSQLKQGSFDQFFLDSWAMMEDFDSLTDRAIEKDSIYDIIIRGKIDGLSNLKIQEEIMIELNIERSPEYISSLWRNKIPKMIAEKAYEEFLLWHFTFNEKGSWKKCSRCGEVKLSHAHFFSKNAGSRDGLYSICKACRNKKEE